MENNLFIVNTPFHLLTSFILSKSVFSEDNNYLAIMHPQGYEHWENEPVLKYISSKDCGYKDIFLLLRWFRSGQGSYKKQIEAVNNMFGNIEFDKLFFAVDIDEQAQLLVAILGKKEFYRFDDGLGSYSRSFHSRSRVKHFFHSLKIKYICKAAKIKTNLKFNTKEIGASEAVIADYSYRPDFLLRPSPQVHEITNAMVEMAVLDLKGKNLLKTIFERQTVLYLGQPIKRTKEEEAREIDCLRKIMFSLDKETQVLFKPHARDSEEKIERYKKALPNLKVFNSKTPVELLYISEQNLQMVIAYNSSALLFGEKFTGRKIRMVSLAKPNRNKASMEAIQIMKKAGVEFLLDSDIC